MLPQGLTIQYLTADSYHLQPNDLAVVHVIVGGEELLLTQLITASGERVMVLISSEAKRQEALKVGAEAVFPHSEPWKKVRI